MSSHLQITDSHVHIFSPKTADFSTSRSYTPATASVEMLEINMEKIGAKNVVLVQPSPYATNNSVVLNSILILGVERAKAVAVIDVEKCSLQDLRELAKSGVVAIRANLKTSGISDIKIAKTYLEKINTLMLGTDLALQLFMPIAMLYALKPILKNLGRPIILDHWAGIKTSDPNYVAHAEQLIEILALPNIILKTSGTCRATNYGNNLNSLDRYAPEFINTAKGRVIWGSDWPHTGKSSQRNDRPITQIEPFMEIDDCKNIEDIRRWAGSKKCFTQIMCDTPNALFGFN